VSAGRTRRPLPPAIEQRLRQLELALFLADQASEQEPLGLLDYLRAIQLKFPDLSFADFVAAVAHVEDGMRAATAEAEAKRLLH
jgi:hypothetical protein